MRFPNSLFEREPGTCKINLLLLLALTYSNNNNSHSRSWFEILQLIFEKFKQFAFVLPYTLQNGDGEKINVMEFFFSAESEEKAKCNLCNHILSYKTSTSNLKKHMVRLHPLVNVEMNENQGPRLQKVVAEPPRTEPALMEPSTSTTESGEALPKKIKIVQTQLNIPKPINLVTKKKIDRCLMSLFTKDYQPFSVVEDEGFRSFVNCLNPAYQLPSRKTITYTLLPSIYEETFHNLQSKIKDVRSVTLTTDCWTSINIESFMAVTIHYIDNFQLHSALLECSSFPQDHTSENLANQLKKVVVTWGLENKILIAVSDNTLNIKKAIKYELKWKHFGCFAHTINLIAEEAIVIAEDLIKKVRDIVSHFKRSSKSMTRLIDIQKQMGKSPNKLLQDVRTRWNSTFYMVQRIIELEEWVRSAMAFSSSDKLPIIVNEEWKLLSEIKIVLEPLETITNIISGEKYVTLSSVIVLTKGLENILTELRKQDNMFAVSKTMISRMLQSIKERLGDLENSNTLIVSTFLDPRYKNFAFSSERVAENAKKIIISLVAQKITESTSLKSTVLNNEPNAQNPESNSVNPIKKTITIWSHFDSKVSGLQPAGTSTSRAIIEVQRYLEDGLLERNKDPLIWWKEHAYNYPYLSQVVVEKFGSVATSVPSERIFSKTGQILSDRRARLSSEKVQKLVFLNVN
ncbi:E3 SUMO-protein ligase ZBED1-like [Leptinotarsa decemlineata]|uniref:E3 SUMO-protein ligase ZBED1-like n=1 Tax=Leptinotarsa decemlineata TaxID=7539 RepID=UPI003D309461